MLRRLVFTLFAVSNLLLLDQVVKELSVARLADAAPCVVIDGFFRLRHVVNKGCAWGMLQGHVWPLALFAVAALAVIVWQRRKIFPPGRLGTFIEYVLYAGIVGNLVDRVLREGVIDMFEFHWGEAWSFPVFNVADVYISVAAGLLVILGILESRRAKREGGGAKPSKPAPKAAGPRGGASA